MPATTKPKRTKRARDKYDDAVDFLTANTGRIPEAWKSPTRLGGGGCLFSFCTPSGATQERADGAMCGCLTIVRARRYIGYVGNVAWTAALTRAIRADRRLPTSVNRITVEHLPLFARWQRRIDRILRRS